MVATDTPLLPWSRPAVGQYTPTSAVANAQNALNKEPEQPEASGFNPFGDDGFSFLDLIDVVNPLQHVPVIGTVYREITGDTIGPLPRIAGSTLYFGPVGAVFSSANVVLEEVSGQDVGEHIMTALSDGGAAPRTVSLNEKEVAVTATRPVAAGTDGEQAALAPVTYTADDPVSAWARAELAYREGLARQHAAAQTPTNPTQSAQLTATPAAASTATSVAVPQAVPVTKDQAMAFTPTRIDRPAAANASAAYEATLPPSHNAVPQAAPPAFRTATDASRSGAVAPGGGWFAANIIDGLARYGSPSAASYSSDNREEAEQREPLGKSLGLN